MKVVTIKGSGAVSRSSHPRRKSAGARKNNLGNRKGTGNMKRKSKMGKKSSRRISRRKGRKAPVALKSAKKKGVLKGRRRAGSRRRRTGQMIQVRQQIRQQQRRSPLMGMASDGLQYLAGAAVGNWALGALIKPRLADYNAATQQGWSAAALLGLGLVMNRWGGM